MKWFDNLAAVRMYYKLSPVMLDFLQEKVGLLLNDFVSCFLASSNFIKDVRVFWGKKKQECS